MLEAKQIRILVLLPALERTGTQLYSLCLVSLVFTRCSDYCSQDRLPAPMLAYPLVYSARRSATLVGGRYDPAVGAFDLEAEPTARAGPAERARHADAMGREKANYFGGRDAAAARGTGYK